MSQRERMRAGAEYDSRDPELIALAQRARGLLATFAGLPAVDVEGRSAILHNLFGAVGEGVWLEPPFGCDYGVHIEIGARTFVNMNCVFLDAAPIRIGKDVLIGPGVQLLTASHPLAASERLVDADSRRGGAAPYRTFARPITIGDGAWIGAGTQILPGVTVGEGAVIGAGSVVTADVPSDCVAFGNPCRVQRSLGGNGGEGDGHARAQP
ncbi:MAG: sugar O-acetyltransferase [Gemmatimonadota bacterium]|jgi:maltose O-acetyltransferase|nr:sugar O-acetyltransferase [Gemmatimonadota bacterium]